MRIATLKKMVRQVRLKRLIAEIESDEPPTPLPKRFDTRPIDFGVFKEVPCRECGEMVRGKSRKSMGAVCEECKAAHFARIDQAHRELDAFRLAIWAAIEPEPRTVDEIMAAAGQPAESRGRVASYLNKAADRRRIGRKRRGRTVLYYKTACSRMPTLFSVEKHKSKRKINAPRRNP